MNFLLRVRKKSLEDMSYVKRITVAVEWETELGGQTAKVGAKVPFGGC